MLYFSDGASVTNVNEPTNPFWVNFNDSD
jgi:hypothetical protein